MDELALERLIGRLASLSGPPAGLVEWARDRGHELFIVPVLPSASLNESLRTIREWGHSAGALVTAQKSGGRRAFHLVWLAAEAVESDNADTGCGLPTTPSTTVADLLRILQPGASMTLRLGSDELFFRPDASAAPIADKAAIKSLRSLSST